MLSTPPSSQPAPSGQERYGRRILASRPTTPPHEPKEHLPHGEVLPWRAVGLMAQRRQLHCSAGHFQACLLSAIHHHWEGDQHWRPGPSSPSPPFCLQPQVRGRTNLHVPSATIWPSIPKTGEQMLRREYTPDLPRANRHIQPWGSPPPSLETDFSPTLQGHIC